MSNHQQFDADTEKAIIEQHLFSDTSEYQDIMNLPHHVSKAHLPMSKHDRAGQFAPFSALTGFHQLIDETAHNYQRKKYLGKEAHDHLNRQLHRYQSPTAVNIRFFNPDSGYYETVQTNMMQVDWQKRHANFSSMQDSSKHYSVPIENIASIHSIQHS